MTDKMPLLNRYYATFWNNYHLDNKDFLSDGFITRPLRNIDCISANYIIYTRFYTQNVKSGIFIYIAINGKFYYLHNQRIQSRLRVQKNR